MPSSKSTSCSLEAHWDAPRSSHRRSDSRSTERSERLLEHPAGWLSATDGSRQQSSGMASGSERLLAQGSARPGPIFKLATSPGNPARAAVTRPQVLISNRIPQQVILELRFVRLNTSERAPLPAVPPFVLQTLRSGDFETIASTSKSWCDSNSQLKYIEFNLRVSLHETCGGCPPVAFGRTGLCTFPHGPVSLQRVGIAGAASGERRVIDRGNTDADLGADGRDWIST